MADLTLPERAAAHGMMLTRLALPARFGCAIIEVERNGHPLRELRGDFMVFSGDRLLLVGEEPNLARAVAALNQGGAAAEPEHDFARLVLDTCTVSDAHSDATLAELRLAAEAGVRVVGIQRGGERIISPAAGERIRSGDDLLLVGTLEAIRRFRHAFSFARRSESRIDGPPPAGAGSSS